MKKILPMKEPIIRCYPALAGAMSILEAHNQKYHPWVYNYFAQLYVYDSLDAIQLNYAIPDHLVFLPTLFCSRQERSVALDVHGGIINLIKFYVDHEYYILTSMQVNLIADYKSDYFFVHNPTIYGYDDEKREIYFMDHIKNGKYAPGIASYDEIESATGTEDDWKNWGKTDWIMNVNCLRFWDRDIPYQFDKETYASLLKDYMEERNLYFRWPEPYIRTRARGSKVFGLGIYKVLKDYVDIRSKTQERLDRRGFFVLKEHKEILEKAFTFLFGEEWKEYYPIVWNRLQFAIQKSTIILNLCLKYNITKDKKLIDKLIMYISEMEQNDRELFPGLISIVEESIEKDGKYKICNQNL